MNLGVFNLVLFKKRLKEERTSKGLSQEELGKYFNLDKSTISLYESGKRQPDYDTLAAFAKFFNCSTDYLLGSTNQRYPAEMFKERLAEYTATNHLTKESSYHKTKVSILDDLLMRVPNLTEEEKESLVEHMELAFKHIEMIRKLKNKSKNEQ